MSAEQRPAGAPLVRKWHTVYGRTAEHLAKGSEQVREGQTQEVADWWTQQQQWGKVFGKNAGESIEHIKELATKFLERKAAAQKQQQQEEQALAELKVTDANVKQEEAEVEDEEEEDEVMMHADAAPLLQSSSANASGQKGSKQKPGAKAKAKGSSKNAEARAGSKAKTSGKASAKTAGMACSDRQPGGGSSSGCKSEKKSPVAQAKTKATEWVDIIQVHKFLTGEQKGNKLWQASSTLASLNQKSEGCCEALMLETHLKLARKAEDRVVMPC